MTSRFERYLFVVLVIGSLIMISLLLREHHLAHERYASLDDNTPLMAPFVDTETITFDIANNDDGSIASSQQRVALPAEPAIRARALLDRLFAEYALPTSQHHLNTAAAIDEVYLIDLPITNPKDSSKTNAKPSPAEALADALAQRDAIFNVPSGRLAIVSLRGSFVQSHPSGVEVEDLTLRSIIGTIHANLPDVAQIRFLVDGQPAETLAGHADLTRAYTSVDTVSQPQQPLGDNSRAIATNPDSTNSQ